MDLRIYLFGDVGDGDHGDDGESDDGGGTTPPVGNCPWTQTYRPGLTQPSIATVQASSAFSILVQRSRIQPPRSTVRIKRILRIMSSVLLIACSTAHGLLVSKIPGDRREFEIVQVEYHARQAAASVTLSSSFGIFAFDLDPGGRIFKWPTFTSSNPVRPVPLIGSASGTLPSRLRTWRLHRRKSSAQAVTAWARS